jgi:hypothetical protein
MAKAAEDVHSSRNGYWQAYDESQHEYPAKIFSEILDGDGESAQCTQSLTPMCEAV